MRIVQSLIGGLLGSATGTGLYYALVTNLKRPMPWAVVIIGILAGLGVRVLCGKNRNLITGLMATATALVALLGYNFATISAADLSAPPVTSEAEEYPPWVDEVEIGDEDEIEGNEDTTTDSDKVEADNDKDTAGDEGDSDNKPVDEASASAAEDENSDDADLEQARAADDSEATLEGKPMGPVLPTAPSSQTDAIALALTGLLAYVIGRGNGDNSAPSPDSSPAT